MTGNEGLRIGGILLAAGGSSRLGRPKQLLEFENTTLLRRAAEAMAASICRPVVAVLGAEKKKAEAEIADIPIKIYFNRDWQRGMSSSIKIGLTELLVIEPKIDAVVITLCDQPFVDTRVINRLASKFTESDKLMIAAEYDGVAGVPALFSREMFDAISRLEGDKGARDLIRAPNASIETIEIKEAAIDIDTLDDIGRLKFS
jgi:molybdenum cofactor cytidylyltransferase